MVTDGRETQARGSAPRLSTFYIVDAASLRVYRVRAHSIFVDFTQTLNIVVDERIVRRITSDFWGWVQLPGGKFIEKPFRELEGKAA